MVAAAAAPVGNGADGRHLVSSRRRWLDAGLRRRAPLGASLLHPRNDARLAGAEGRAFLPFADAASLLPLRLRADPGEAVPALWHRAAGRDRPASLSRRSRRAGPDASPRELLPFG